GCGAAGVAGGAAGRSLLVPEGWPGLVTYSAGCRPGIRSWDIDLTCCNLDEQLKLFVSRHSATFSSIVKGKKWGKKWEKGGEKLPGKGGNGGWDEGRSLPPDFVGAGLALCLPHPNPVIPT
uniref:Microtubule-associated protein 1B/S N-terminal domain-containing protein n=1 Tax=Junco hyemalis TaxID=40217 RepID=A0A8C5II51_JUNHY